LAGVDAKGSDGRNRRGEGLGLADVTWFVRLDDEPAVLRHPPRHVARLATAHDLLREARYLQALAGRGLRVPTVVACCRAEDVLGVPFVITGRCPGVNLLEAPPPDLDATALAHDAIDLLAAIHAVAIDDTELRENTDSYLNRQIERWHRQLQRTATAPRLGELDHIRHWLHTHRPEVEARTIVHGDYGFHNLLVSPRRVEAVLDWELATLGDPIADVYSFLKSWGPGAAAPNPANDVVARAVDGVDRATLLARYGQASGRDVHAHRAFYEVFGLWRSVGILEGIHHRSGGTRFGEEVPALVTKIEAMMVSRAQEQ
jgi:aminoglycoside phosphotransferase (APT) family kinase protein